MKLLRLDDPGLLADAAEWLARKDNYQWLDFGQGRQIVTPAMLRVMSRNDSHFLRAYTNDDDEPIGILGLSNVDRICRTALLWAATGARSFRNRGFAMLAAEAFLSLAFRELELVSINTWCVEHHPSRRLIERLNFRYIGRQHRCHRIDGRYYDRLYYTLAARDHVDRQFHEPTARRFGVERDVHWSARSATHGSL